RVGIADLMKKGLRRLLEVYPEIAVGWNRRPDEEGIKMRGTSLGITSCQPTPDDFLHRLTKGIDFVQRNVNVGGYTDALKFFVDDGYHDDAIFIPQIICQLCRIHSLNADQAQPTRLGWVKTRKDVNALLTFEAAGPTVFKIAQTGSFPLNPDPLVEGQGLRNGIMIGR